MSEASTFVLATWNTGKADEIRDLLGKTGIELLSCADIGLELDVEEDGNTYAENALKKACAAADLTGIPAIADDSGLEVDSLDGAPGIRSARFAGETASDEENNRLLLKMMEGVPEEERGARFVCTAVLVYPGSSADSETVCSAEWRGTIGYEPKGSAGFGYDPVFVIPGEGATVAELGDDYKREHSHRSKAFRALARHLETLF